MYVSSCPLPRQHPGLWYRCFHSGKSLQHRQLLCWRGQGMKGHESHTDLICVEGKSHTRKKKKRLARIYLGWTDPIWESTAAANPLSRGFMALLEQCLGGAVGHPCGLRKGGEKYSQGRNEPAEGTQLLQLKQKIYTLEKSKIPQWHVIQMRVDWSHPVEGSF